MSTVEHNLHMVSGDGETSYAKNSRLQGKAMLEIMPILQKAMIEVYTNLHPQTVVVADLGCSSGPNTLRFVSEVIDTMAHHCDGACDQLINRRRRGHVQIQFFLNDLPGNDFNGLFHLVAQFKESEARNRKGESLPPYYISGLPGSYYTRLFPCQTVHLFHSLFCLHWRSQAPEGLEGMKKTPQDEQDVYISKTSLTSVVKLYHEQFQKDFSIFLRLRYEELVVGGQMVLTFIGSKNDDVRSDDWNHHFFRLFAQSLQSLVEKGLVQKKKLESFYVPMYLPSVREVEDVVKQSGLFEMNCLQMFESNWDPYDDDLKSAVAHDSVQSGINVAKFFRAVIESVVASHFGGGDAILDMLFSDYAGRVAKHLSEGKPKIAIIVVSLKKKIF